MPVVADAWPFKNRNEWSTADGVNGLEMASLGWSLFGKKGPEEGGGGEGRTLCRCRGTNEKILVFPRVVFQLLFKPVKSLLKQPFYCFYGRLMIEMNLKLLYMFWAPSDAFMLFSLPNPLKR